MQKYFAFSALVLLAVMVIIRVSQLKKQGVRAFQFGKTDKKDFLIPPFVLFYFYLVFANVFQWPSLAGRELFHSEIVSWIGVAFCITGLAGLVWSLVSFKDSFRVGIDVKRPGFLVTTGVFSYSRNPIYVSFWSVFTGQFLVYPGWVLLVYLAAAVWLVNRQVLREESFLLKRFGRKYSDYCKRVRRYL
jgi:protein-S-isoprenylcysteine O-methyltransferase Ste14